MHDESHNAEEVAENTEPHPGRLCQATLGLGSADPWAYKELGEHLGCSTFLWHEPGEQTFAAFGEAAISPTDAEAGRHAWCSQLAEQIEHLPDTSPHSPLFLSALGFDDRNGARGPGEVWAGWGSERTWLPRIVIRGHQGGAVAIITATADDLPQWCERLRIFDADRRPVDPPAPRRGYHTLDTCGERDAWTERVGALVDAMSSPSPELRKVVLARAQQLEAAPGRRFAPLTTAWHLRRQQPGCVTFAWQHTDGTAFVGATPELLCRVIDDRIETCALAGTAPRGRNPGEDQALATTLAATGKEQHEHRLVVDGIVNALVDLGIEVSTSTSPRIRQLQDVQHLETPISGALPPRRGLLDVVSTLHPTPAVGGVPREEALRWLAQHEGLDRGHYAGPIGWFEGSGRGAMYVALRSVFITLDSAWAFAGAGIVSGSEADAEWREVNHKLRAIRSALTTVEVDA
jgi:salicylate biosynthesis isochorismate synthase